MTTEPERRLPWWRAYKGVVSTNHFLVALVALFCDQNAHLIYVERECKTHGLTRFIPEKNKGMKDGIAWRCYECRSTHKRESRRRKKAELVVEAGGACRLCGYRACMGALDFHHLDPAQKNFAISQRMTWSKARLRSEVEKCILLCKNCHHEVEEGLVEIMPKPPKSC